MFFINCFHIIHCCLVDTCWERADLLAVDGDVYCIFITFPCGILGPVWYLIVSFPDLCRLSYFAFLQVNTVAAFREMPLSYLAC